MAAVVVVAADFDALLVAAGLGAVAPVLARVLAGRLASGRRRAHLPGRTRNLSTVGLRGVPRGRAGELRATADHSELDRRSRPIPVVIGTRAVCELGPTVEIGPVGVSLTGTRRGGARKRDPREAQRHGCRRGEGCRRDQEPAPRQAAVSRCEPFREAVDSMFGHRTRAATGIRAPCSPQREAARTAWRGHPRGPALASPPPRRESRTRCEGRSIPVAAP
jgi:hypothetical protein